MSTEPISTVPPHVRAWARLIKRYRADRGLTQIELGDLIGANQQKISALERGQYAPGAREQALLIKHLGIPPDDVYDTHVQAAMEVAS